MAHSGSTRVRVPEVWGRVPKRNVNFTGRKDLLEHLHASLSADVTAVVPHALHGFGGVGKTQVAIEYAYRSQDQYDLVWWVPADQPDLVKSSLAGLAPHLGLQAVTGSGIDDTADAVLDALRRGDPYERWLLIFDNADQPEDLGDVIPHGPGHVLITSRNHRWQGVVDTLAVDVFSREESKEFLSRRASITPEDANRLAEQLGDLPLALEQAAALQKETGISVDDYLVLLKERTGLILAESKPSEYPLSMTGAWALSVQQLRGKLPEAVDLLRCCAFFGPEPIPRDVFRLAANHATDARLSAILRNPILLSRAIRELGRFALVQIDSSARTIQVHRLVQALLREDLDAVEQNRYRHEVHLLLSGAAQGDPDKTSNWERYGELIAHVRPSRLADCAHPHVRATGRDIVTYLNRSGDYRTARTFAEELVHEWTKASGGSDPDVLIAQRLLGTITRELGDLSAAYEVDRSTLERMLEVLGPDHRQTLILRSGLAADLRAVGDFRAARELDEELRLRYEAEWGEGAGHTLRIMNNLAIDHLLNSDYPAARDLYEDTYQQQSINPDVGASNVVAAWSGLARAVRLCGDVGEARDVGEEAHAYGVQMLGGEHLWTLRTAKDLSIALRRAGDFEASMAQATDVYQRLHRTMGEDHPDTVAAASNLSNAMRGMGDVEGAFKIAEQAVGRYRDLYGEDHPYTYGCMTNLAILHRLKGDLVAARSLDEAALAGLERKLGRDHHYTLTCAVNLASDLAALGLTDQAREIGQDSLTRLEALFGPTNPLTLICMTNLALDLAALGLAAEEAQVMETARNGYARTLGLEHPDARLALVDRHRMDGDFDPPPI